MNNIEPDSNVMRATPRGRWLLAMVFIVALALIALYQWFVSPQIHVLFQTTALPPAPHTIFLLKSIFFGMAGVGVLTAIVLIAFSFKILRSAQCPPPGAWLWRDATIVRGHKAIRYAWLHIAVAIITCIACIGMAICIAIMLDRLAPTYKLPPGVTLIEQKSFTVP